MNNYSISNTAGKPTLYINGKKTAPVLYGLSDFPAAKSNTYYAQKNIAQFASSGVNLVTVDTSLCRGWKRVSSFNSASLIADISHVLDANPNAHILLRLHMNPPYWWLRDNPDECVVYRTQEGDFFGIDDGEYDRLIENDAKGKYMRVSIASKKWINDVCEKLEIFLNDLKDTPEGNAVMAIQVACGVFGEWHQWGIDVSKPMQERFKEFLKEKYETLENLRLKWNNEDVTFESAVFNPDPYRECDDGYMRDPKKSMDTIDSLRTVQLTNAEAILSFAKKVKEILPNTLCGSFYGYYISVGGKYHMAIGGHLSVDELHKSPYIDFLCGPFCYANNRKPDGIPTQRALIESNRLCSKLWLTEMDQGPSGVDALAEGLSGGDKTRLNETLSILYRNTLQPLLSGMGFWYYDHRMQPMLVKKGDKKSTEGTIYRKNGWWDTPFLMKEIKKIQKFAEKLTDMEYKSHSDILVVYDIDSYYYRGRSVDAHYSLHEVLGKCGVSYDCIYSKELDICDINRYKCIIFVNSYMISDEDRAKYRKLIKGKTAIYLGTHGYCNGEFLSEEYISDAVGMKVIKASASKTLKTEGEILEVPENYGPLFKIIDEEAEGIAYFENGECAAAKKNNEVYVSLHTLPYSIAKSVLKDANVHFWTNSSEPVITGFDYVAINCHRAGERTLNLPNGKAIKVKTKDFATLVYDINTGKRVL